MDEAITHQRELFALLDEIFQKATGKTPRAFAALDQFSGAVQSLKRRTTEVEGAFAWGIPKLYELYERLRTSLFAAASNQGGLKVVLGGTSRFGQSQLNVVRRLILYADTVLVPDPVLAWIETDRREEKFRHIQLLEAMFFLLRLKPLVDSECAYPPIIVFPSYERTLARRDPQTQEELEQFYLDTFSPLFEQDFDSFLDFMAFTTFNEDSFLEIVDRKGLFVGPGGPIGEPLRAAIGRYREDIQIYRSDEFLAHLSQLSEAEFVGNALMERLEPQFHLIRNATELRAQPLLALEQHAYYFKLLASLKDDALQEQQIISAGTRATIDALSRTHFSWLSNVGIDALAEMRLNNENDKFREQLSKATSVLADATLDDIDRVAAEVTRSIGSLVNEHRHEAQNLENKYKPKYAEMAATGWMSAGGLIIPHLSPLVPVAPALLIAGKYVKTKLEERREKKNLSHSLLGILASAKDAPDSIE